MKLVPFSILSLLVTVACVGDKNTQDYRDEYAQQQLAKVQAIAGVYRDNLVSVIDNKKMGVLSLTLYPDTKVQPSSDGLYSEQQAIVRGTINYKGAANVNIVFDQGVYIPKRQLLKAAIKIQSVSGTQTDLFLTATVSGAIITGKIEVSGFPDYGGSFTLVKDAPMPTVQDLTNERLNQLASERQVFVATYIGPDNKPMFATMGIAYLETTPEQFFERMLEPRHDIQANIILDVGAASEFQILFDSTHIDERTSNLKGKTQMSDGAGIKHIVELDCNSTSPGNIFLGWDCEIKVDGNKDKAIQLQFKARKK